MLSALEEAAHANKPMRATMDAFQLETRRLSSEGTFVCIYSPPIAGATAWWAQPVWRCRASAFESIVTA